MDSERLPHTAAPEILDVLSGIGRTEDVKLSPLNDFLAIADASNNQIVLIYFEWQKNPQPCIHIFRTLTIRSTHLNYPHGIAFVDSETMVVANRLGDVTAFKIPADVGQTEVSPAPLFVLSQSKQTKIQNPGSVDIYELNNGAYRMLVCNNHLHTVTSHKLKVAETAIAVSGHRVVARRKLIIPDGLAVSPDKRWLAVSNHVTGELMLYRNHIFLNRFSAPSAVLGGMVCPHGVRFSSDGKHLVVADAASPYLHLFERGGEHWKDMVPTSSVRFLNESQFTEGRTNPEEGGLKGLDMSRDGNLLVTTCELDTLAFYDLHALASASKLDVSDEIAWLSQERDEVLTTNIYATAKRHFWE